MRTTVTKGTLFLKKNKKWKEYFGVFQPSSLTLWLFDCALDYLDRKEAKKEISFKGSKVQVLYEEEGTMKNLIKMAPAKEGEEPVYLCAVDQDDREKWAEAFEDATFNGKMLFGTTSRRPQSMIFAE